MEVDVSIIFPVFIPSLLLIWMGSLYLRKKSVVLSAGTLWGLIILMFLFMYIAQIIGAYQRHLDLVSDWRYGSPPTFNWYIYVFPIIIWIPFFFIFIFFFKNAIMIYNIKDEDLSNNLSSTLEELKWEYDRDFTYIHIRDPKIKIKVGMMDPMRTCQIFFREVKDKENVKQFSEILKTKIIENRAKPFLPLGLGFIFLGIFIPMSTFIMIAMI